MICITTEHFNLNRILLLAVGLWPYQQSILVRFQLILLSGIQTSFIVFQLTTFATAETCTPELIIKVLSSFTFFLINVIKYNSFWLNIESVKSLFEKLQQLCNELRDENEVAIIKDYASDAKRYTIKMILLIVCSVFTLMVQSMCPRILSVFLFTNESRPRHAMLIATEYFVDQEKYFHLILLHTNTAIFIGAIVIVATGTTLIGILKHACGMFKVASYRIEQALVIDISQNVKVKDEICKNIIYAVDMHRKTMTFTNFLLSHSEKTIFFLIMLNVICLSLNLFQIFQIILLGEDIEEATLHFTHAVTIILNMFLSSYAIQEITDHNNHVFATVYNVRWYMAPVRVQKMILFLLQRNTKVFNMTVGGIFVVSLESFSTLASTSVSYFTVLYSMRQ